MFTTNDLDGNEDRGGVPSVPSIKNIDHPFYVQGTKPKSKHIHSKKIQQSPKGAEEMKKKISVINVPFALGSHRRGCDLAPQAVHYAGLIKKLEETHPVVSVDVPVTHVEDEDDPSLKNLYSVYATAKNSARLVDEAIKNGNFPLIIGGDHSISIGTIAGITVTYPELGVIWVDAHGDVNMHDTTLTGNIHGMPLAINMGFGLDQLTNTYYASPKIKPKNVVILGTRDLDDAEILFLKKHKITHYAMEEVRRKGLPQTMKEIEEKWKKNGVHHLHISFDMDSLDP
jgi:arginase